MEPEIVKARISELVEKFEKDKHYYCSKGYPEAQLRKDFIDPFFEALGWDMENKAGLSPFERDVILEKGETKGRPDYNFRVDGLSKFFVEAKAPSVPIDKTEHILQAKSYAYNTKEVFIVVLTDFEEFKVYDASLKPDSKNPNLGLLFDLKYTDFIKEFDKIRILSKQEVSGGSLETLLKKDAASKRLRIPVDKSFLNDMTDWREQLAKDLYRQNSELSVRTINDIVQRILDRLVFIRICEDRNILESRSLSELVDLWRLEGKRRPIQYHLNILFRKVNDDLNGEIFKPHDCERYEFDSELLARIINNLYFPNCPYRFDVIGVELLGTIYERYLGKTIRLTPQRIKVEDKPEVRHAGGVYYTPKYIVDYIVDKTVGRIISGKTPGEISKIRILDPACGSGSFLIGAFRKLIDYHIKYYEKHPEEAKVGTLFPMLIRNSDGTNRLSIEKKAEILKNNIHGVDLDPQAVEITMLSLYIKALGGERTLPHNKELLPSLANNIKCGNSLLGFNIFDQQKLVEDDVRERVNPFEWNSKTTGFGDILELGGFDVVLGNPPYIRIQEMKKWASFEVEQYKRFYESAKSGNYDIYVVFIEKGLSLLKQEGMLGFINPHKFFQAEYGKALRKIISDGQHVAEIVNFTDQQVFEEATTYTCLLFLSKKPQKEFKYAEVYDLSNPVKIVQTALENEKIRTEDLLVTKISEANVIEDAWGFGSQDEMGIKERIKLKSKPLSEITVRIFQGLVTGADPVFIMEIANIKGQIAKLKSKSLGKVVEIELGILKPLLKGAEIKRYSTPEYKFMILFPYKIVNGKAELYGKEKMETNFPKAWEYLNGNRKKLQERDRGNLKVEWYAFGRTQNIEQFYEQKIMTQVLASKASFTYDPDGLYYFVGGGNAGGYGIKIREDAGISYHYLLGLLNSSLLDFYLKKISTRFRGGFYSYAKRFIEKLPIHVPDDKTRMATIEQKVQRILELKKKTRGMSDSSGKDMIERESKVLEEEIDKIIYDIYGLTPEEIKVVEEAM